MADGLMGTAAMPTPLTNAGADQAHAGRSGPTLHRGRLGPDGKGLDQGPRDMVRQAPEALRV